MDDADDPDPAGPAPRAVFYGLWPRFPADEDGAGEVPDDPSPLPAA